MLEQIEVMCPHKGCSYRTHSSALSSHIESCDFRSRDCPICKETKASLLELMGHLCGSHSDIVLKLVEEKYKKEEEISVPFIEAEDEVTKEELQE